MPIRSVLDVAHEFVGRALAAGEIAVDATVGNGHDTVVLAQNVGADGLVFGFDVQREALRNTRDRLEANDIRAEVELIHRGHEEMSRHLSDQYQESISAIMFNLGYLPGSESSLTTEPETTVSALDAAAEFIRPGGVVTVVVYTGHDGGAEEAAAVDQWATHLPQDRFDALSYRFVNQRNNPPRLVAVEKDGHG